MIGSAKESEGALRSLPEAYIENMKRLLGEEALKAYLQTFEKKPFTALRINTRKTDLSSLSALFPETAFRKVPWCASGLYYEEETSVFSKSPLYAAGLYYLQEPSAMAPASLLPVEKGDKVLDLCAAPGGKSTQLYDRLFSLEADEKEKNGPGFGERAGGKTAEGLLFSNDVSPSRARALLKNLELFGARRVIVTSETPYALSRRFPEYFDKILVDAPCSGEGMFHKEPEIMKNWEQYGNAYYAKLQKDILPLALECLKPGGMLLYSTCTFHPMENEEQIQSLLDAYPELSVVPLPRSAGMVSGGREWADKVSGPLSGSVRFFPHLCEGQGHFAVLLQKAGRAIDSSGTEERARTRLRAEKGRKAPSSVIRQGAFSAQDVALLQAFFKENLLVSWEEVCPREGYLQKFGESLYFSPFSAEETQGLRVMRNGMLLGEIKKDRFEPSQALSLCLAKNMVRLAVDLEPSDERLLRYLRGEGLEVSPHEMTVQGEGNACGKYVLILTASCPLGFAKLSSDLSSPVYRLKNKYHKGWMRT